MSMIKCPECGKNISDKAEKCPHCGISKKDIQNLRKTNDKMTCSGCGCFIIVFIIALIAHGII